MTNVVKAVAKTSDWPNKKSDYDLGEVIGVGSAAVVHEAYCKRMKQKCAIKRINGETWLRRKEEMKAIQALLTRDHKNVVKYFTVFVVKEEIWLVTRLLNGGSISDVMSYKKQTKDCSDGVLDEEAIATILRKVLKGLMYLHNNGQIHRGIKPENILLSKDGNIQITGFGLSTWHLIERHHSLQRSSNSTAQSPCWMAPEIRDQLSKYDCKVDIWSFGMTAIELITGKSLHYNSQENRFPVTSSQNDHLTIESVCDKIYKCPNCGILLSEIIASCLRKDPSARPSAAELLKHPFFEIAKKRKYLLHSLLPYAPSIDLRALKIKNAKRSPETCGWGFDSETNDWVWSLLEEKDVVISKNHQNIEHSRLKSEDTTFPEEQDLITF